MKPWPRHVQSVTNHALVRYIDRVLGISTGEVETWLRERQADDGDAMVLSVLEARGIDVESIRKRMLDEVNQHKREADMTIHGEFLIKGATGRFVVSMSGTVITAYELINFPGPTRSDGLTAPEPSAGTPIT